MTKRKRTAARERGWSWVVMGQPSLLLNAINTYLLGARETVCFVTPKISQNMLLPLRPINKRFIIISGAKVKKSMLNKTKTVVSVFVKKFEKVD